MLGYPGAGLSGREVKVVWDTSRVVPGITHRVQRADLEGAMVIANIHGRPPVRDEEPVRLHIPRVSLSSAIRISIAVLAVTNDS